MNKKDKWFLVENIMLECSIAEKISLSSLCIVKSKKTPNKFYIVDKASYLDKKAKTKIYFKKEFNKR